MRSIRKIKNITGKIAVVRVDFNVPIVDGKVEDDFRIRKSLPTLEFLLKKGVAKIVILAHLGKGGESLAPIEKHFLKISKLSKSKIEFFDNVRNFPGEEKNDPKFTAKLAALGDFYVNDAFSVSHREHASVVGVPKLLPSYAGFQLEEEVKNLKRAEKPKHPFLFILGGVKFSTKMPLIQKYLKTADQIFIGGALLNDFLKAKGYEVGRSITSQENYGIDKLLKNEKIILPDYVEVKTARGGLIEKKTDILDKDDTILDVGHFSVQRLSLLIHKAKFILWNGPLGKYEAGGAGATKEVLELVAKSKAESIIGGGDTVALISDMGIEKKFTFVSTGGGATLDFLANGTLPGIKALK